MAAAAPRGRIEIDGVAATVDGPLLATLTEACESAGWDPS
jgi:hypothetical protein